jgi:hypothetical protein
MTIEHRAIDEILGTGDRVQDNGSVMQRKSSTMRYEIKNTSYPFS